MKFDKSVYTTFAKVSQLGISMIVPILLCTYAGSWLEKKTEIPFTVIFIVLGILAGARNVYAILKDSIQKKSEEEDEEE